MKSNGASKSKNAKGPCHDGDCISSSTENNWPSKTKMRMVEIEKVREEFPGNRTFFMAEEMCFWPGQFAMVWLPGVDEKPIALIPNGKKFCLNIEAKGGATKRMLGLKAGDKFGIRGPYGKGFDCAKAKKTIVVAGGIGTASVVKLCQKLKENKCKIKIVLGGRTKERIIFEKELKKCGDVLVATDDGSRGEKGFNVHVLERLLRKEKFHCIYACGPEMMMLKALELSRMYRTRFEASLERYMKCGIGICGECACGDRLVCRDGPVFNGSELEEMEEFGDSAYLKSGRKVGLKEYYEWRQG
ncbi:Sulfhydrogenase 1 subunit gamma [uncultured archaeon]|nr:Sulfhydrogenase 1 subunit gamma [uncultured archaeon]